MTTKKSRKTTTPAANASAPSASRTRSKAAAVIALLKRDCGATLDEMMAATGWQKHSVRGFMAGALKKRHGLAVTSANVDQGRSYRIAGEAQS